MSQKPSQPVFDGAPVLRLADALAIGHGQEGRFLAESVSPGPPGRCVVCFSGFPWKATNFCWCAGVSIEEEANGDWPAVEIVGSACSGVSVMEGRGLEAKSNRHPQVLFNQSPVSLYTRHIFHTWTRKC